ncbi:MAG: hypothetical protein KDC73_10825 [Ignavibacteriae bacterium]|nr:hypothetical protein [Ignavibacteriota bacterium]MCB0725183.1 hypothetical protein [Ignavibacteriota bacterium]MCB9242493.1 hypothetical protein [Ignavibacteriales bacterium]
MQSLSSLFSKVKYFLLSLIFVFLISASPVSSVVYSKTTEITTEKVLVEGVWWIYVYEDGILINTYPDDEGD